jgi:hypothetical protein
MPAAPGRIKKNSTDFISALMEYFFITLENTVQCQSIPASAIHEKFIFRGPANWKFL